MTFGFAGRTAELEELFQILDLYSIDEIQFFIQEGEFNKEVCIFLSHYLTLRILKEFGYS